MSDPRMLDLLMRCQNGDATCLFVLHEIERQDNEFRDEIAAKLLKLCHAIEELPAGEKQTAVSIMASAIRTEVIGCVDAYRPQPASSALNAAREIPQTSLPAKIMAVIRLELKECEGRGGEASQEMSSEDKERVYWNGYWSCAHNLEHDVNELIAKHSQAYAGAGESELREALEKVVALYKQRGNHTVMYSARLGALMPEIQAALTPRVASTGSL